MLFGKKEDGLRAEAVRRVKGWVAVRAHAQESDAVLVTELQCTEDGCPPVETVLALLRPGEKPRRWKVHKPVALVTEEDGREAIEGRHGHAGY